LYRWQGTNWVETTITAEREAFERGSEALPFSTERTFDRYFTLSIPPLWHGALAEIRIGSGTFMGGQRFWQYVIIEIDSSVEASAPTAHTKRLIDRGAILESLIEGAATLTNNQIHTLLTKTINTDTAQRILSEMRKQNATAQAEKESTTSTAANTTAVNPQEGERIEDAVLRSKTTEDFLGQLLRHPFRWIACEFHELGLLIPLYAWHPY